MTNRLKTAQQILREKGFYQGNIDGIFGPMSEAAIARVTEIPPHLPRTRRVTMLIQLSATEKGMDAGPIDGLWGPRTEGVYHELQYFFRYGKRMPPWRPEELIVRNPNNWPVQHSPEFLEFYGPKGSGCANLDLPYELKLSWELRTKVRRVYCHRKIHESLSRVLQNVLDTYGHAEIQRLKLDVFGGCYSDRRIRNGTAWSMHAWGIALDFDPTRNQLNWGRDRAAFAHPDYYDWWKCWEDEGWLSLGRARNYDWMHVQAARLP